MPAESAIHTRAAFWCRPVGAALLLAAVVALTQGWTVQVDLLGNDIRAVAAAHEGSGRTAAAPLHTATLKTFGADAAGFRVVSLVLHLAAAWFLFFAVLRLVRTATPIVALCAALIFAGLPATWLPVLAVERQGELAAGLLLLGSAIALASFRRQGGRMAAVTAIALAAAAPWLDPRAATVPLVVAVLDLSWLRRDPFVPFARALPVPLACVATGLVPIAVAGNLPAGGDVLTVLREAWGSFQTLIAGHDGYGGKLRAFAAGLGSFVLVGYAVWSVRRPLPRLFGLGLLLLLSLLAAGPTIVRGEAPYLAALPAAVIMAWPVAALRLRHRLLRSMAIVFCAVLAAGWALAGVHVFTDVRGASQQMRRLSDDLHAFAESSRDRAVRFLVLDVPEEHGGIPVHGDALGAAFRAPFTSPPVDCDRLASVDTWLASDAVYAGTSADWILRWDAEEAKIKRVTPILPAPRGHRPVMTIDEPDAVVAIDGRLRPRDVKKLVLSWAGETTFSCRLRFLGDGGRVFDSAPIEVEGTTARIDVDRDRDWLLGGAFTRVQLTDATGTVPRPLTLTAR